MYMKKYIIWGSVLVILALIGGGYYYWKTKMQTPPKSATEQAAADIQKAAESVTSDIGKNVSPDVTTPTANPYKNTNPYSNLKTNPFQ